MPIADGLRFGLIVTFSLMLAACSISQALRPNHYTVKRGDTLYSIGQHFNVNWHKIARWNHIGPPYRIYVGENLTLKPYPKLNYAHMGSDQRHRVVHASQESQTQQQRAIHRSIQRLNEKKSNAGKQSNEKNPSATESDRSVNEKNAEKTSQIAKPEQKPTKQKQATQKQSSAGSSSIPSGSHKSSKTAPGHEPARTAGSGNSHWQWPASGAVVQSYSEGGNDQGIEIGGKTGEPVYAASSGTVVYNGPGLKGFGRLIIIKHPHQYLSAYGFVRQSRVNKGEHVRVGQRIASMGQGPKQTAMLHFEIRHDGDPINPTRLLPDR